MEACSICKMPGAMASEILNKSMFTPMLAECRGGLHPAFGDRIGLTLVASSRVGVGLFLAF